MTGNQLTSVFMRLRTSLRNRAMVLLRSESESDDALQDAFCRLWMHRSEISDENHAAGLSYAAVRSVSIDKLRRKPEYQSDELTDKHAEVPETTDDTINDAFSEIAMLLNECLSSRDSEILRKREMYGYGYDELSEEYGITYEAVRAIVSRGRRAIRTKYMENKNKGKL